MAEPDKAEAEAHVAKIKADAAVEQQRRREAEAKKVVSIETKALVAQSEKARTDYLKSFDEKPKANEQPKGEKSEIELGPTDSARLGDIVAAAMQHLASSGTKIYQRAGSLMRPLTEPMIVNGEPLRVGELVELNDRFLKMMLMRAIRWSRRTKEGKRYVSPGYEIPKLILALRGAWPFQSVTGVINAPTLRRDGSLLCEEGYDAKTGLAVTECATRVDQDETDAGRCRGRNRDATRADFRDAFCGRGGTCSRIIVDPNDHFARGA
jgi:hypothetical protein